MRRGHRASGSLWYVAIIIMYIIFKKTGNKTKKNIIEQYYNDDLQYDTIYVRSRVVRDTGAGCWVAIIAIAMLAVLCTRETNAKMAERA